MKTLFIPVHHRRLLVVALAVLLAAGATRPRTQRLLVPTRKVIAF